MQDAEVIDHPLRKEREVAMQNIEAAQPPINPELEQARDAIESAVNNLVAALDIPVSYLANTKFLDDRGRVMGATVMLDRLREELAKKKLEIFNYVGKRL